LNAIANVKSMPDRMYVLMKENFPDIRGKVGLDIREFEKPNFRPGKVGKVGPRDNTRFRKFKPHKNPSKIHPRVKSQLVL